MRPSAAYPYAMNPAISSLRSPILTLLALFTLSWNARATVLFSTGPSTTWVSSNAAYQRTAAASGSGPYTYTNAFSDTTALTPSSGYSGPTVYGGYSFTSSTINSGFSAQYVRNAAFTGSYDYLWLQTQQTGGWDGSELSMHGTYLFKQSDFGSGYTTGILNISNISVTMIGYGSADSAGNSYDATGRFMVQIGGVYYVTESTFSLTGNAVTTFSLNSLSSQRWAVYDPSSSLDFDQSAATYGTLTLTGVTEVGVYFEDDSWTGTSSSTSAFGLGLSSIIVEGSVVPEPSTMAMATTGMGALALLYARRRR